ncbi:MAG: hypothetical protein MUF42_12130 [Cytophagaceae bacterium]|jgi:hypothetical protein|nr:hypothetical protein [Cytophagaceae bacterium]
MKNQLTVLEDTIQQRFGKTILVFGKWKVTSLGLLGIMEEGKNPIFIKKSRLWDYHRDPQGERYYAHPMEVIESEELSMEEFYEFYVAFGYARALFSEEASLISESISECLSLQMGMAQVIARSHIQHQRVLEEKQYA